MKFGKELLRAVDASQAVIHPDTWLDYKGLKKMLKKMPPHSESDNHLSEAEKIMKSSVERDFFRRLSSELIKVETRFAELKTKSLQLAEEFSSAEIPEGLPNRPNFLQEKLTKCAAAHLFVLLVENYAVLNYCGFTKILKKHDKLRLTNTKVKYMSKMVNDRSFAKFDDVRAALQKLEHTFSVLTNIVAEEKSRTPTSSDEKITTSVSTASVAAASSYDAQRKELIDINHQSMDRLKSLANTVLSLEEQENSSDDTADDPKTNASSAKDVRAWSNRESKRVRTDVASAT